MRRPQPLPTPPRREPEPSASPEVEAAQDAPRPARKSLFARPERRASSEDDVATDVDLPTFDSWTEGGAPDPDAETDVIADDVLFAPVSEPEVPVQPQPHVADVEPAELAPVVPITPAVSPQSEAPSSPRREVSADADAPAPLTGWRDVWRASRAHRKALRSEVRRFTVRSRRRRTTWIVALSAVGVVVIGSLGIAYSPLFSVQQITVLGTTALPADAVKKSLADEMGSPLAAIDRAAIQKQLSTFPLVETYSLEARPPHELVVRIVERTPVGVIATSDGYALVDAAGVTLSTSPTPPSGAPVISVTGGADSPAFAALGFVMRSLPDAVRTQVTAASATTAHDVTLTLGATGTTIVWGGSDDSVKKSEVLATIMAARPPAQVKVYDVSSPANIIVR